MTIDLGTKTSDGLSVASQSKPKERVHYPGFSVRDKNVKAFLKVCPCTLGDEIEVTVKLKVTSLSNEYENRISFDVIELKDPETTTNKKGLEVFD